MKFGELPNEVLNLTHDEYPRGRHQSWGDEVKFTLESIESVTYNSDKHYPLFVPPFLRSSDFRRSDGKLTMPPE